MKARLTGGLVAAALLGAGLVCPGVATAADPTGYPHQLGFTPSNLIATDDAVYAAGVDEDSGEPGTVYVADVGGDTVPVAADSYLVDMAVEPDGSALRLVTSGDDGYRYWEVDTDDLAVTDDEPPAAGHDVELLGTDSGGVYEVQNGPSFALHIPGLLGSRPLAENASASASTAIGADGERTWYVAGSQYDGDDGSTATLWSYDEQSGENGTPVALGAADDPDQYVLDVAADQADGVVYALSFRNNDDAPQSYGLTIVQDGRDAYVPLPASDQIELSPDGDTLYVTQNAGILALDTAELADYTEDSDVRQTWIDDVDTISSLAVDSDGNVFAGTKDQDGVYSFSTPGAPTDLVTTPDAMSTTAFSASWDEGKYAWELDGGGANPTEYVYTVRDSEGHVVDTDSTYDQVVFVDDLQRGTTYTVEVTASDGLLTSEPVVGEVTTYDRYIGAPSAVTVQGSLTVGSQLSLATTGSWEEGTAVSYEWYGSSGEMGGAIGSGPTLTLTADDLGMTIVGVATGTKSGAAGVTIGSPATAAVSNPPTTTPPTTTPPTTTPPAAATPGKLTAPKPKITGKAKVGKTLAAKAGAWTRGTKLTYHWSANGKRIKGADHARLKLTKALKGKRISVEVTGTKAGYKTATKESKQTGKVRR